MFNSFSRSHVWMSELDHKESWAPKSWCFWTVVLLKERGPLTGPETGFLSNTWKWIVRGDTCADKARDFIGKGHLGGEQEGKGTQENCSAAWLPVSGFMVMGLVSGWSLANHSNSESFLVAHALLSQWMLARGILGSGQTCSVSFWPFLNSSSWWWLISSVFLIRISCHKTTHANGYYGAWPGWAVSISGLPLTLWLFTAETGTILA